MSVELNVADMVADRMRQDPKVAKIVADAHLFDGLKEHQGWKRLYERVMAQKDRYMLEIAKRLIRPGAQPPSSEEIAYQQGFYQGAVWLVSHPALAEQNLERAARLAWLMTLEEAAKHEQEESPYA